MMQLSDAAAMYLRAAILRRLAWRGDRRAQRALVAMRLALGATL